MSESPVISPSSGTPWGEIEPSLLEDVRAPVPAFPLDLLPPFWRDWVGTTARSAGAPNDYVALSVLAAVAGLAGVGAQVRVTPRWVEPLVLWQAIVGPPSSGKSAAMAPVRDMLAALEPKSPADGVQKPHRVVDDVEIDDVAAALEVHPRGAILWCDEPADLLARLGAEPGRRGDEGLRACWLNAWSGGPVAPGKGGRRLKQFPVCLLFALQPERLAELLHASPELAGRFLFTWPHAPVHVPIAARARQCHDEAALASLRRIADRLSGNPLVLAFDDAGLATFDRFTARLHAERSEAEGLELAWLAKGAGTVARLAGALKLLEWSRDASASARCPGRDRPGADRTCHRPVVRLFPAARARAVPSRGSHRVSTPRPPGRSLVAAARPPRGVSRGHPLQGAAPRRHCPPGGANSVRIAECRRRGARFFR